MRNSTYFFDHIDKISSDLSGGKIIIPSGFFIFAANLAFDLFTEIPIEHDKFKILNILSLIK